MHLFKKLFVLFGIALATGAAGTLAAEKPTAVPLDRLRSQQQSAAAPLLPVAAQATPTPTAMPVVPNAPAPIVNPGINPGAGAPGAPNQPTPIKPGETLLNFQGADLQAVVKTISQITGRNFLLDPRVKGQVTIISAKPVSAAAAYQVFLAAIKAQGFTAVEGVGNLTKIVPSSEAKQNAAVTGDDNPPHPSERLITHVAIVQHASATQLIPLLRPLMAPTSQLSASEPANALIITDYADNVRRMLEIVERLDQPTSSDVTIVPLKHASALDLAELITRLSAQAPGIPGAPAGVAGQAGAGADRFMLVPDLRTNSLLVRTDNTGRFNQLKNLIVKLDVPPIIGGNTRVVYLKNADATKLAEILRGIMAGEARSQSAGSGAVGGGVPGTPAIRPTGASAAKAAEASLIQADESTNAIIISAPDAVYNNLRSVIEKLDTRRAQVFVEALIVEITSDMANQLGFQWAGAGGSGNNVVGGATNFTVGTSLVGAAVAPAGALATAAGLTVALLGPEITLPDGRTVRGLGGLARALEENNSANILSTPNLMTLDNAEAKIIVGQNVPFITGSFAQAAGAAGASVNPFQTIERKDVGLTLKIKPQISDGGAIKLDIFQEVSTVSRASLVASDLITNKRSLETKVVVDDGNTVVLGGLIEDTQQDTEQSVPLLGKIPLLGALFRYREKTNRKTNLMVFLRPVIVRSVHDSYNVTADRYQYLRALSKDAPDERKAMLERLKPTTPPPPDEKKKDDARKENDESARGSGEAKKPQEKMEEKPAPAATGDDVTNTADPS
jgi:general secretion pathway protein D